MRRRLHIQRRRIDHPSAVIAPIGRAFIVVVAADTRIHAPARRIANYHRCTRRYRRTLQAGILTAKGGVARIGRALVVVIAIDSRVRTSGRRIATVIRTCVAIVAVDRREDASGRWVASIRRALVAIVAHNRLILASLKRDHTSRSCRRRCRRSFSGVPGSHSPLALHVSSPLQISPSSHSAFVRQSTHRSEILIAQQWWQDTDLLDPDNPGSGGKPLRRRRTNPFWQ